MLDRTLQPAFKAIDAVSFVEVQKLVLRNNIPVFVVDAGEQELVRIEFIFGNSGWQAQKPLLPSMTNAMLSEGTQSRTASEIANHLDYYGAYFEAEYGYDQSALNLYSLTKYLPETLPVIKDMLLNASFPQKELDILIRNQKQQLKISLEKNATVARREFNHALFGDSLYGYQVQAADFDVIQREDLQAQYQKIYHPANCTIILSGKISSETLLLIEDLFGDWQSDDSIEAPELILGSGQQKLIYIEKPDALQSAIRIGIPTINRTHPDFIALQVLNTVLGGYFGSRLMANIREDKGYTYGIGSGNASLQKAGYFFIATEVGVDVCAATLIEIEKEVNLLKAELIAEEELQLVKNYLMGSLLGSLENAFSHADKFKNLYFYGLGYDYYERYIQTVKNIQPEELRSLAKKYWNYDDFYKVVVGKM
jgi:predicted Zn-dependent peptidase